MRFIPSQPDSQSSSWASAFGLFSFQCGAILLSSLVYAVVPRGPIVSAGVSGGLTVLAASLYALLAESQVTGALRQPGCRRMLALRSAFLLSMVALIPIVGFRLAEISVSAPSRQDLSVAALALGGVFVVPWLEMWMGLSFAVWLRRLTTRS